MKTGVLFIIAGVALFLVSTPKIFGGAAMLGGKFDSVSVGFKRQVASSQKLDLTGVDKLILETFNGSIIAQTDNESKSELKIVQRGDVLVPTERNGSSLTVRIKSRLQNCEHCGADLTVQLSRAIQLEFRSINGDIVMTGRSQSLQANAVNGNIKLQKAGAGQYSLSSTNGDITLENASGNFGLNSINGDISASQLENAVLRLNTNGGTVDLENIIFDDSEQQLELINAALNIQNAKNARLNINSNGEGIHLENLAFTGISHLHGINGEIVVRNSKDAILKIDSNGANVTLEQVGFSAGSSNTIASINGDVTLDTLVLPTGLRLTGQTVNGTFENSLRSFVTRTEDNDRRFESVLAGTNPVRLEVSGNGSSLVVQ